MHGSYNIKRLVLNCKMLFFDVIGPGKLFQSLVPLLRKLDEALPLVFSTITFFEAKVVAFQLNYYHGMIIDILKKRVESCHYILTCIQ